MLLIMLRVQFCSDPFFHQLYQIGYLSMLFDWMAKILFRVHGINIAAAITGNINVSGIRKVGHNPVYRTLCDSYHFRYVTQTKIRILRNAYEHMSVIC